MYNKITIGWVTQEYDENGVCIDQRFIAGDEVVYENEDGEAIPAPEKEQYQPFDMVQPTHQPNPPKE